MKVLVVVKPTNNPSTIENNSNTGIDDNIPPHKHSDCANGLFGII